VAKRYCFRKSEIMECSVGRYLTVLDAAPLMERYCWSHWRIRYWGSCDWVTGVVVTHDYVCHLISMSFSHSRPCCRRCHGIKHALDGKRLFLQSKEMETAPPLEWRFLGASHRCERISIFMLNNTNYGTTVPNGSTTLMDRRPLPLQRRTESHGYPLHVPELVATMRGVCYAARAPDDCCTVSADKKIY